MRTIVDLGPYLTQNPLLAEELRKHWKYEGALTWTYYGDLRMRVIVCLECAAIDRWECRINDREALKTEEGRLAHQTFSSGLEAVRWALAEVPIYEVEQGLKRMKT